MYGGFDIFWLIFLFFILMPMLKQWNLERQRMAAIRSIENKTKSRVITLIHRQESVGFLGMFLIGGVLPTAIGFGLFRLGRRMRDRASPEKPKATWPPGPSS